MELTVQLAPDLAADVERMAAARGVERDAVVQEALALLADQDAALEARAEAGAADIAAGRFVEHARVVAWLKSWGTSHVLPPPECD